MTFDDNALFRHPDIRELRDITEEDPLEVEASKYSLNYIKLDGSVGCMVNGAGLAMATMDIIKYAGGMPANFLDVGGGANSEQVAHAFEILLSDKNVKAVLINIFGGILRVDTLATGVVEAAKKTNIKLPVVLRLEGTNVNEGKKILMESGLNFVVSDTMKDAADKVVAAARARLRGALVITERSEGSWCLSRAVLRVSRAESRSLAPLGMTNLISGMTSAVIGEESYGDPG